VQVEAQRRRRFHAIEVDDFAARERRDVAALANFFDEVAQHHVARAVVAVVEQQVLGEASQTRARAVVSAVTLALQQARGLELLQHAVQRGFGQAGFGNERLQRITLVFRGDDFEQREEPHRRRVGAGCRLGRFGCRRLHDFHGARMIASFH
jgi:hypothetical protein